MTQHKREHVKGLPPQRLVSKESPLPQGFFSSLLCCVQGGFSQCNIPEHSALLHQKHQSTGRQWIILTVWWVPAVFSLTFHSLLEHRCQLAFLVSLKWECPTRGWALIHYAQEVMKEIQSERNSKADLLKLQIFCKWTHGCKHIQNPLFTVAWGRHPANKGTA